MIYLNILRDYVLINIAFFVELLSIQTLSTAQIVKILMEVKIRMNNIMARLDYIKREIEKGTISYGELVELQSLANGKGKLLVAQDVHLREWAGLEEQK